MKETETYEPTIAGEEEEEVCLNPPRPPAEELSLSFHEEEEDEWRGLNDNSVADSPEGGLLRKTPFGSSPGKEPAATKLGSAAGATNDSASLDDDNDNDESSQTQLDELDVRRARRAKTTILAPTLERWWEQ